MRTSHPGDIIVLGIGVPKLFLKKPGEPESGHTNTSLVSSQSLLLASSSSSPRILVKIST